jgi:hypothetical protein
LLWEPARESDSAGLAVHQRAAGGGVGGGDPGPDEETVVAVTGIRAYPAGFGFTLNLRLRNLDPRERRGFWPFPERAGRRLLADAILRLTVEFADGRSVTNDSPPTVGSDAPDPDRPMLSSGLGTGVEAGGRFRDR